MSEKQNCGINDFAKYDSMATEELEMILRLDAEMPEGQESDTDKILYIMEVLAGRNKNTRHAGKTALEAYESFKQNYLPETDNNIIPLKTHHRLWQPLLYPGQGHLSGHAKERSEPLH